MEEAEQAPTVHVKPNNSGTNRKIRTISIAIVALLVGYVHYRYVQQLHENIYHFSHTSDLEREMMLVTEMGFYYSYYKTVVQVRPWINGISEIMFDRLVEYPKTVNAYNRFNIHPEAILGAMYSYFEEMLSPYKVCHLVNRGDELPPAESCVGIGDPMMFYLQAIWVLAGLLVAVIFVFARDISGSIIAGLIAVLQYFANHTESTRVMWTPNERENFAVPLIFLQMYLITLLLRENRKPKHSLPLQVSTIILNCLCLLFWQFSQFIFLTQTAIFFIMEQLKIIDSKTFRIFIRVQFCSLHIAILLQVGNDMLKTSMFTALLSVVFVYCALFGSFRVIIQTKLDLLGEVFLIILRICLVIISSIHFKKILSDLFHVEDDNHIWDLLYSKFSDFKSFHTLIDTCSSTFDFLPVDYFMKISFTGLLPLTFLGITNAVIYWLYNGVIASKNFGKTKKKQPKEDDDKMAAENKMAVDKDAAKNSDTDDSGIENNSECQNSYKLEKDFDNLCDEKQQKDPELPVVSFVYGLKNMNVEPEIFYNISQLVVFGIMAWLFMRLKMLFSTQMCIVSSIGFSSKYDIGNSRILRWGVLLMIVGCLCLQGYTNITKESSTISEFSDVHKEELINWINSETSSKDVFAGSMPISATVMLTARRAVVTHPHYEHRDNRDRAYAVYKMYGRFSPQELYHELTKLQVTYLILEKEHCYWRSSSTSKHCGRFVDIWDAEQPSYASRPQLCNTLFTAHHVDHFRRMFTNDKYTVFRVYNTT